MIGDRPQRDSPETQNNPLEMQMNSLNARICASRFLHEDSGLGFLPADEFNSFPHPGISSTPQRISRPYQSDPSGPG
jgi:hypothetical protein